MLPAFEVTDEMLEGDQVHLVPAAGDAYLSHLSQCLATCLNTGSDDITLIDEFTPLGSSGDEDSETAADDSSDRLGTILKIVKSNSRKLCSVKPLKDSIVRLAETSHSLEERVRVRRQRDNYVFARLKEDADCELNRTRENRVVISGLERVSSSHTTHQAKKDHYVTVVTDLVAKACPALNPKPAVVDVIVNLRRDQANPSIEAKFDTVGGALSFRKSAAALAKAENPDFVKLFFANSVTQATRVRIEIMRAIAKKLTTDTEKAFVQGFMSRPVLRYLPQDGVQESPAAGAGRSYSFVDAVSRFGDLVSATDLIPAYKRASTTFQGAMEQYFVILSELEDRSVATSPNSLPVRPRGQGGRGSYTNSRGRGARGTSPWGRGASRVRGQKRLFGSPQDTPSSKKSSAPVEK